MQQNIDFIDRQPIFDQPAIALEDGFRIGHIEINEPTIFPAPKFLDQMQRNIEVGNRDQWLDLMFSQFFEDFLIKSSPSSLGSSSLPFGKILDQESDIRYTLKPISAKG